MPASWTAFGFSFRKIRARITVRIGYVQIRGMTVDASPPRLNASNIVQVPPAPRRPVAKAYTDPRTLFDPVFHPFDRNSTSATGARPTTESTWTAIGPILLLAGSDTTPRTP